MKEKKDFSTASETDSSLQNISDQVRPSYVEPLQTPDVGIAVENSDLDPLFSVTSKKPWMNEITTRSIIWDYFRTTISLPNPSDVLQKLGKGVEEWDSIICDARVKAAFNNRRSGLLSLQWTLDQNGAGTRPFKLIKRMLESLPITDIMSEMMMAPYYGYNVSEVNWKYEDGLYIPESVTGKAARWFAYSDLNELRIKTKTNMVQGEPVPPRKFIVTRYHPRYDDPYAGREALANALYWPVKFRHMALEFSIQFLEKYGSPWIDVALQAGLPSGRVQEALDMVYNTYNQGIVAHYDDVKVQAMEIGGVKNIESYSKFIDLMGKEIDMAILGQNLSTDVKGGSFAAAKSHMGVRDDIIQEDRRMVEAAFNQLIEWIVWFNFNGKEEIPKFKLHKSEPITKERAEIDMIAAQMGVKFNKDYFARVYSYNHEDFEIGEPPAQKLTSALPTAAQPTEVDADGVALQNKDPDPDTELLDIGLNSREQAKSPSAEKEVIRIQSKGYPY